MSSSGKSSNTSQEESANLTWPGGSSPIQARFVGRLSDGSEYRHPRYPQFYVGELAMAEMLDDKESMEKKVVVGICAMAKKSNSKPMKEIIKRLENFTRLQIQVFSEEVILDSPVEDWPVVNAFISFFSTGFPLDKAIAYKNLRQPFVVNDLEMQNILQDRTEVYRILEENNIPHPRYAVLNKIKDPNCLVVETEDSIEINGQLHLKPFVEKPIDAEDHNVYIYFPQSAGGGSTRLFRKVKDRSSVYSHTSRVRRNGAYLYEDFMPTDGTDVKVYTVGSDYQHAEARKSPCLDGKVERDQDGKEIRYPVLLSAREKLIARKVVWAFGQNVCGFDLLRANGKCYVCDVNGFSFVKTSNKYYDDCARILGTLMLREVCPTLHIPFPVGPAPEDIPVVPTTSGPMMELRCVVALIRHGDRTPKQKMKMEVKNKLFFELFEKYGGFKSGHLKLKRPKQLQEVLDIVRKLLSTGAFSTDPDLQDKKAKLQQMKLVLEMYGHFSGINRKVQLKYQPQGRPKRSSSDDEEVLGFYLDASSPEPLAPGPARDEVGRGPSDKEDPLFGYVYDDAPRDPSLLLILKWGGELTPAGRIQAESLGKAFRTLYPGGQGQFEAPGLGFLRLHSTFRHDLKIYASDEGRVQMTAAAFTKGLLALEGELTPILVQMVKSANTNGLLDGEGKTSKCQIVVKEKLKSVFNQDHNFTPEDNFRLNSTGTMALVNAMDFVKNPQDMCQRVHKMIQEITSKIRTLKAELKTRDLTLYNGESWELLIRRWAKLEKDFQLKSGQFEISKIPDIYDCIKYDLQHNQKTLQYERAQELFMCCKALADIIVPQEYGITVDEKLHIAQNYCSPFLRKIRSDFLTVINPNNEDSTTRLDSRYSKGVASPERFVRTRLYFTSESHIHSMLNMLRYGNVFESRADQQWERALSFLDATAELNYMSQIVFMLFEDPSKDLDSDERYHMELHFSPGAYTSCDEPTEPRGMGYRPKHSLQRPSDMDAEKLPETLASAFLGPLPSTSTSKRGLRLDTSDLSDICESDMFEQSATPEASPDSPHSHTVTGKQNLEKPKAPDRLPVSPDPNIPEWDWGEDNNGAAHPTMATTTTTTATATTAPTAISIIVEEPSTVSPIPPCQNVDLGRSFSSHSDSAGEFPEFQGEHTDSQDSQKDKAKRKGLEAHKKDIPEEEENLVDLNKSLSETDVEYPCMLTESDTAIVSNSNPRMASQPINITSSGVSISKSTHKGSLDEKRSRSLEDKNDPSDSTTFHRNYKTVHLPLHNERRLQRSLPCVFSMGFNCIGSKALEGFSYVPQLHPLETLHNTFTYREIDDFLGRITSQRFPMPAISPSIVASRPSLMLVSPSKHCSYPPSSNSSSGPSSPCSIPTPVDFLTNLRMFIERSSEDPDQPPQRPRDDSVFNADVGTGTGQDGWDGAQSSSDCKRATFKEVLPESSSNYPAAAKVYSLSYTDSNDTLLNFSSSPHYSAESVVQPQASFPTPSHKEAFHKESQGKDAQGKEAPGKEAQGKTVQEVKAKVLKGKGMQEKDAKGKQIQEKDSKGQEIQEKDSKGKEIQEKDSKGKQMQEKDSKGKQIQEKDAKGKQIQGKDQGKERQWKEVTEKMLLGIENQATEFQVKGVQGKKVTGLRKEVQGKEVQGKEVEGIELRGKKVQGIDLQGNKIQGKEVQGIELQGKRVQGKEGPAKDPSGKDGQSSLPGAESRAPRPSTSPTAVPRAGNRFAVLRISDDAGRLPAQSSKDAEDESNAS